MISIIKERLAKWIGRILHDIIEGRISGKRPTGRPHQKTLDWTTDEVNGKLYSHLKEKTKNRQKWRVVH